MHLVKNRMLKCFMKGELMAVHAKLTKEMSNVMQYKWQMINTVLYLVMKEEKIYKDCTVFCYFVEYFFVQFCPECKVESAFSIIKLLISKNYTIGSGDINTKIRIIDGIEDEFTKETQEFIEKAADKYLEEHGPPFVKRKRSKKKQSTVIDRKTKTKEKGIKLNEEYDSVSEQDTEFLDLCPQNDEASCFDSDWEICN